jgi:hypothetical protein
MRISCSTHTRPPPQLNSPSLLRSSPQIAFGMTKPSPDAAVVVIMIKMQSLTRQHRQAAPAARLAVRLSQQRLTQLLMLTAVPGSGGVHPAATAPRHNTPPLTQTHPTSAQPHAPWSWSSSETTEDADAASPDSDAAPSRSANPQARKPSSTAEAAPSCSTQTRWSTTCTRPHQKSKAQVETLRTRSGGLGGRTFGGRVNKFQDHQKSGAERGENAVSV